MSIQRFEDIIAWQFAKELTLDLYTAFSENKDFAFKNQLLKASVSIMNNIAEGFERKTNNEFKYFLYVSKGSAGEVRSMLCLAKELTYITEEKYELLSSRCISISKMIAKFIQSLN